MMIETRGMYKACGSLVELDSLDFDRAVEIESDNNALPYRRLGYTPRSSWIFPDASDIHA